MRKRHTQFRDARRFDLHALKKLESMGYKYVQIKGLSTERRYDYLAPHVLLLVPLRELPSDPREKDIYEPIPSAILEQWATEPDEHFRIFVANPI